MFRKGKTRARQKEKRTKSYRDFGLFISFSFPLYAARNYILRHRPVSVLRFFSTSKFPQEVQKILSAKKRKRGLVVKLIAREVPDLELKMRKV